MDKITSHHLFIIIINGQYKDCLEFLFIGKLKKLIRINEWKKHQAAHTQTHTGHVRSRATTSQTSMNFPAL